MELNGVQFPEREIASVCDRFGVARLSVFGSVLRGDCGPDSDVDLLVEFLPGQRVGLFKFCELAGELSRVIGRNVDLKEAGDLSPPFRRRVINQARLLHAA